MAVVDYFLKIDGIDGESVDSKHKGEIQLESWSWGATNTANISAGGGGGGAGRVTMSDFQFTSVTSKASPKLFLMCASGRHIKTATLTVRKTGERDNGFEWIKITFMNLLVNFYKEVAASVDTPPTDDVGLAFQKIEFLVSSQSPTGALEGSTAATFDVATNKAS